MSVDIALMGRVVTVILSFFSAAYYIRRVYALSARVSVYAARKLLYTFALVLIAAVCAIPHPPPWPIRALCITALFYCGYVWFLATHQIARSRIEIDTPIYRDSLFWFVTLSAIIEIILIYLERHNLGSFVDNEYFNPTITYYIYYSMIFIVPAIVILFPAKEFLDVLLQFRSVPSFIRVTSALIAIDIGVFAFIICLINLWIFQGSALQRPLNLSFQLLRPLFFVIIIPIVLSTETLSRFGKPLEPFIERMKKEQFERLKRLRDTIQPIVLCIASVPDEVLSIDWLVTELGFMRDVVWSQTPHWWYLTARREAQILFEHIQNKQPITDYGSYGQLPSWANTVWRNIAVAHHLVQMQRQNGQLTEVRG